MNTYQIERATPATLADAYALHPDCAEAEHLLTRIRERIAAGQVDPSQFVLLRSQCGIEGVTLLGNNPAVPLFPRYREDTSDEQITAFLHYLHQQVRSTPERQLVLDSGTTPLRLSPVEAAGWLLDDTHLLYETDLTRQPFATDPQAQAGGADWLDRTEIQTLLRTLGQAEWVCDDRWQMVALPDQTGVLAALGAVGPSNRSEWANINLIGVLPEQRGQGYGTRLHAHLLYLASQRFTKHIGGTSAQNHAMRRIFEKNGSQLASTQMYFQQG